MSGPEIMFQTSKLALVNGTIFQGDVLQRMKRIPSASINCVVTSPPYFDVRDYGIEGQWGREKDVWMYLDRLKKLMESIRRVLRPDGIAWVNLGDSIVNEGWFGFPEFFFTDCRKAGWRSVSKPIWYKRNAMQLSTQKRFTPRYENLYGFSKSDDYYFNLDAVRVARKTDRKPFNLRVREAKKGTLEKKYGSNYSATPEEMLNHTSDGVKKQDTTLGGDGKPKTNYKGYNDRWKKKVESGKLNPLGKNPGDLFDFLDDIFDITVRPFKEAHFATFPEALPDILIKASCPPGGWVLDPFFGAGTVGLVANKLQRNWVGIELKPEYIELAKRRLEQNV